MNYETFQPSADCPLPIPSLKEFLVRTLVSAGLTILILGLLIWLALQVPNPIRIETPDFENLFVEEVQDEN